MQDANLDRYLILSNIFLYQNLSRSHLELRAPFANRTLMPLECPHVKYHHTLQCYERVSQVRNTQLGHKPQEMVCQRNVHFLFQSRSEGA